MFQAKRHCGAVTAAAVAGLICLAAQSPARAATVAATTIPALPPVVGLAELFAPDGPSGLALSGFDPVTYYLGQGPQPGRPEYEIVWGGVAWRFATAANRAAFAADPEAYAPRLGGYDATAAAGGLIVGANPLLFAVTADKLYLFRSDHARARFMADQSIADKAEERWSDLKQELLQP
ncbi:MAG TPA: YHS domain-containing (seleno)protein [Beijerinckiaceae bacterium]|jgi:hypothetical protein